MADTTKSEAEKIALKNEILCQIEGIAEQKRQRLSDPKHQQNFISSEREGLAEEGAEAQKANRSTMWTDNEKSFLENVTMDLIPDDEALNVKGKTVRKWDRVKKRYVLQKVDREGKVMRERRNESGAKVGNKDKKQVSAYKNWQTRTHLSLQRPGEQENKKLIEQAT